MRVLAAIVAPPHLQATGSARAAEQLAAAMMDHCDVTVASMAAKGEARETARDRLAGRLPVRTRLPLPLRWSQSSALRTVLCRSDIPDIVHRGGFDLVHIHSGLPAMEMERIARACARANVPYILSTHGLLNVLDGAARQSGAARGAAWHALVKGPLRRVLAHASGVLALSPADREAVQAMGFAGPELSVVPDGATAPDQGPPGEDAGLLVRLGISPARSIGQVTCCFLGDHGPGKGLPELREAFAAMQRPFLLIIGGEKRGGVDYDALIRSAKPGQQIVVTGRLSEAEIRAVYARSDVFVYPPSTPAFPEVVLQAMAHGVPVLASRIGSIPYQTSENCGVLVTPGNADELRSAIEWLAPQRERLAAMGDNARRRALTEFAWEKIAWDTVQAYRRVLEQQPITRIDASRTLWRLTRKRQLLGKAA